MTSENESGSGLRMGVGCALAGSIPLLALWGMYELVMMVVEDVVTHRAEFIEAQAQAALHYATARQMDAVTVAMQAQMVQGRALPWLLGVALVLALLFIWWQLYQQAQLRRLVVKAALGQLEVRDVATQI